MLPKRHFDVLTRGSLFLLLLLSGTSTSHVSSPVTITRETIAAAERIIDLQFSEAKRDSMIEGLEEQRADYQRIRKVPLANNIPPAQIFSPLPIGFSPDTSRVPFVQSAEKLPTVPQNLEDLAFESVGRLGALIKSRKLTSVALTRMYLARLKTYGPGLNCVVSLTEELALRQARRADEELKEGVYRGPLHGIPYGLKDLFATKGARTTWGSVPYKEQVIDEDAAVVQKLADAGAVLVAKLSLGELAWGDVWFGGKTRNPWNPSEGSSGSSAGSAAATSAGLVAFAIGTETWGSIVSPSTRCGVTGLRPTFGRVSRYGAMALSWSMDKVGPICRTVEDCALVFNAIYGPDGKDQSVINASFNYSPLKSLRGVRLGYLKADFDSSSNRKNDLETIATLGTLGATLVPISLPDYPISSLSVILNAEAGAAFDELTRSGKDDLLVRQIKNAWPNVFRVSRFIPAVEYIQANRIRFQLVQQMESLMNTVDAYVAPSLDGDNLLLTNLTGHPCVVLPNGFKENGSPASITFIGQLFGEAQLLAVAKVYQDSTSFHHRHPRLEE